MLWNLEIAQNILNVLKKKFFFCYKKIIILNRLQIQNGQDPNTNLIIKVNYFSKFICKFNKIEYIFYNPQVNLFIQIQIKLTNSKG